MTVRLPLLVALAALALPGAAGPTAEAKNRKKACCSVTYVDGDTAVATGVLRYPKDAKLLHVGMDPPIGACTFDAGKGRVRVRKEFDLDSTVRGMYRFSYIYRWKGEVRYRDSPRFLVKGRG